jgi:hypothetical protein
MSIHKAGIVLSTAGILFLLAVGCASRGPGRIPNDRFDYNQAIARSANEQMLLNLVRLRYTEVPHFLTVNSVLTQYVYTGSVNTGGAFGASAGEPLWSAGAGASARYIERPTITYSPLSGQEFAAQLVSPVPTELLFSLVQSGWPPDQLMVMCIQRLNDLENLPFAWTASPESEAQLDEFRRAMRLFIDLAMREAVDMHRPDPESNTRYMVLADKADAETQALIDEFREMIGLSRKHTSFKLTTRIVGRAPDEVTVRVRSILDLMGLLSQGVDVPSLHLEEGRADPIVTYGDDTAPALVPLNVRVRDEPPTDAFVAVQYADHWYYIKHADQRSKQAFGLLIYLFQMQAPQLQGAGPLITVPTG